MASVCEVYERGVQGAGALALWSVEPVVRRLEPQCESSNAARGEGTGGDTAGGASRGAGTGTQHPQRSPQPSSPARSRVFARGSHCSQQLGLPGLGPPGGEDPCPAVPRREGKSRVGQQPLGPYSPSVEPTGFLLWGTLPLVIAGGEGLLRGTPKQGLGHKGWVAPRHMSVVSRVPSPPAASSPGCRKLSCPSWVRPQLGSPLSLWLSPATWSRPAGLFCISPPAARLRTEGHHLHPAPKRQKHHWQLRGQDPGAGSRGLRGDQEHRGDHGQVHEEQLGEPDGGRRRRHGAGRAGEADGVPAARRGRGSR